MTYSYSQLSHYLSCPRRYRHRYLDGWQEKDTRAAMLFGRCFEQALGACFRREDAAVTLYREWSTYQKQPLRYGERDSWDRMLEQGVQLLNRFCQEDRIRVVQPRKNLQIKFLRPLSGGNNDVQRFISSFSPPPQTVVRFLKSTWRMTGDHETNVLRSLLDFPQASVSRTLKGEVYSAEYVDRASASVLEVIRASEGLISVPRKNSFNNKSISKHGHPCHLERSSADLTPGKVGIQCERACAAVCVWLHSAGHVQYRPGSGSRT